jgi:hypothetical protein
MRCAYIHAPFHRHVCPTRVQHRVVLRRSPAASHNHATVCVWLHTHTHMRVSLDTMRTRACPPNSRPICRIVYTLKRSLPPQCAHSAHGSGCSGARAHSSQPSRRCRVLAGESVPHLHSVRVITVSGSAITQNEWCIARTSTQTSSPRLRKRSHTRIAQQRTERTRAHVTTNSPAYAYRLAMHASMHVSGVWLMPNSCGSTLHVV